MAIIVKRSLSSQENAEEPIKKGWRKIAGTTNSITIPKEAQYARIILKGTVGASTQNYGIFLYAGNQKNTAYNRRTLLSSSPNVTEQALSGDGYILQLLPAGEHAVASTINLWLELQFPMSGSGVIGHYSSHATNTFDSRLGTFEYYRQSADNDHTYELRRTGSTVTDVHWIAEYLTAEDFESLK